MAALTGLTSQRVLDDTMSMLQTHIPLHAAGYRCQTPDLWRVLLAATAQHRSIEAACADLDRAPHPNTIRGYLAQQWQPDQLPTLQQQCNAALHAALPDWLTTQPQDIAIDTHDMPFYGRIRDTTAEQWVCGGKAKASTTWHYRCATATVLTPHTRLTIALMFVQPGTTMDTIVTQLLATIQASGITIGCLYADRGFATVAVFQHLQQAQIPAVIALAERGPRLRAQCQGRESRWVQHTLTSRTAGNVTVKVAVVRTFRRTKRRRRRAAWCLFVCLGIRDSLIGVRQRYRARCGAPAHHSGDWPSEYCLAPDRHLEFYGLCLGRGNRGVCRISAHAVAVGHQRESGHAPASYRPWALTACALSGHSSACRSNPAIKTFYERLRAAGKPMKVARCAAARKLVHIAWAVATKQRSYDPHYSH